MPKIDLKTVLVVLSCTALFLGLLTYFTVFDIPPSSVSPIPLTSASSSFNTSSTASSSLLVLSSSTPGNDTSSPSADDASASGTSSGSGSGFFGTAFATPALSWTEGDATLAITAAALQGNQLSFTLSIKIGGEAECVPMNMRLVADESGDLQAPSTPSFSFPDTQSCNGGANEDYENQSVAFTVDPANLPLLFTTGGGSNIFFEVATANDNGLSIQLPSTSG